MKKILALLLSALMLMALLTGCGGGDAADEPEEDAASDGELEHISVMLDWYPNAVHTFLYEAEKNGYFEEAGLDVEILYPANPTDPLTMAAAGKIDFGFYYQGDTIIAKANEGVPVKVVGAVVQEPVSVVCSLADQNIKTAEDLVGKTVGYTGVRLSELTIEQMMESVGHTGDDVEMMDVGFDLMSAMTTGNVNATIGCFINHEIPALEEQGFELNVMSPVDYGNPNSYALILVAGEEQLEARKDAYTRFIAACEKGFDDMQADPAGALQLLLENQDTENFPLTESVEKQSFDILLPMMEKDDAQFLSQDPAVWQANIDWLKEKGMIQETFAPEDIIVDLLAE